MTARARAASDSLRMRPQRSISQLAPANSWKVSWGLGTFEDASPEAFSPRRWRAALFCGSPASSARHLPFAKPAPCSEDHESGSPLGAWRSRRWRASSQSTTRPINRSRPPTPNPTPPSARRSAFRPGTISSTSGDDKQKDREMVSVFGFAVFALSVSVRVLREPRTATQNAKR